MPYTCDRAEIIHFAGRHRLSPALRDGVPALVGASETAGRCGWAEFFAGMRAGRLAASFERDDPSSFRLVPPGGASAPAAAARARAPGAFEEARRFLAALRGRPPRG
jgi:hypothetical protein